MSKEQETINRWREVSNKNPLILFEQGWSELSAFAQNPVVKNLYVDTARKDPTNAIRLIGNIPHNNTDESSPFDRAEFAKDVLMAAVQVFPSAADTYPAWKAMFKDNAVVLEAVNRVVLRAQYTGPAR